MAFPPLWIYKCNAREHSHQVATGDWDEFFAGPQPGAWGGSTTIGSARSLKLLRNAIQPGDLVLCWQTNRRRAVGLCRVDSFDDWTQTGVEHRQVWLELLGEPFSPTVPILELKKQDPKVASVRAFRQGMMGTLYETSQSEARVLLRACGISPTSLARLQSSPSRNATPQGGAGFGSPAENRRVEQAAIRKLLAVYTSKGWQLTSREKDKVGYDFDARHGSDELHIELKGARGPMPSFPITEHEVATAKSDPDWQLAVVTDALSSTPRLSEWTADAFLREFTLRALSHMARKK